MREIKFRAWDTENKIFYSGDLSIPITRSSEYCETRGYILLQFTGLKDKNGKEIYESDIIKTERGQFLVLWEKYSASFRFGVKEDTKIVDTESPLNYQDIQIIGNIWETPELLA